jgi:hypothetical protein
VLLGLGYNLFTFLGVQVFLCQFSLAVARLVPFPLVGIAPMRNDCFVPFRLAEVHFSDDMGSAQSVGMMI